MTDMVNRNAVDDLDDKTDEELEELARQSKQLLEKRAKDRAKQEAAALKVRRREAKAEIRKMAAGVGLIVSFAEKEEKPKGRPRKQVRSKRAGTGGFTATEEGGSVS